MNVENSEIKIKDTDKQITKDTNKNQKKEDKISDKFVQGPEGLVFN